MMEQSTMWGNARFTCKCGANFERDTNDCAQQYSVDVHHWTAPCPICEIRCKTLKKYIR